MFRTTTGTFAIVATVCVVAAGVLSGCGHDSRPTEAAPITATAGPAQLPVTQGNSDTSALAAIGEQSPPAACVVNLNSPAVAAAVANLPMEPFTHSGWATDPATFEGNYNPCATLSTAIVTIQGATASSPQHALMFHKGQYLGTATSKAYGFTRLVPARTTDDTVALDYWTPGTCDACPGGTHDVVTFHWDGTHVVMSGKPPTY